MDPLQSIRKVQYTKFQSIRKERVKRNGPSVESEEECFREMKQCCERDFVA